MHARIRFRQLQVFICSHSSRAFNPAPPPVEDVPGQGGGYTEINFAAFAMLGLRFCPRIRGVQHQRI
jgi:hypothetical protein